MSVVKLGWMSTSRNLPVSSALIKLSAFDDAFVKQYAKLFGAGKCARSWTFPEQDSFRNVDIKWTVFFCSGKWIVLAAVTRFFAAVLMWMVATSQAISRFLSHGKFVRSLHHSRLPVCFLTVAALRINWARVICARTFWSQFLDAVSTSAERNFLNHRTPILARFGMACVVLWKVSSCCAIDRKRACHEDGGKPCLHKLLSDSSWECPFTYETWRWLLMEMYSDMGMLLNVMSVQPRQQEIQRSCLQFV